jgi:hypothetical protein
MAVLFPSSAGPVSVITNYYSGGGVNTSVSIAADNDNGSKEILSGALTANTLATVYTKTGRGRINLLTAYTKDTTARTVRCRITIDGAVAYDATTNSISSSGHGQIAIGNIAANADATVYQPIDYQTSILIQVASSLTETDKIAIGINAEEWAS